MGGTSVRFTMVLAPGFKLMVVEDSDDDQPEGCEELILNVLGEQPAESPLEIVTE